MVDRSLDKLLSLERAAAERELTELQRRSAEFERQYAMSSTDFYQRFRAGELGDSADFVEWSVFYEMGESVHERLTDLEPIATGPSIRILPRLKTMPTRIKPERQFAICIRSDESDLLTPRRIYEILPDESAAKSQHLRVIDNEGEDYLYPASYFVLVDFPPAVEQALLQVS